MDLLANLNRLHISNFVASKQEISVFKSAALAFELDTFREEFMFAIEARTVGHLAQFTYVTAS